MKLAPESVRDVLNALAGTTNLDVAGAANVWAGTTNRDLIGALNAKNGTTGLGLNAVCNALASTSGLDAQGALRTLESWDGKSILTTHPTLTATIPAADGEVDLSWTSVTNAGYYSVQRSIDGRQYETVVQTKNLTYNDTGLLPDRTYYYKVVATIAVFDSPSNVVTAIPTPEVRVTEAGDIRVTQSDETRITQ